jgi:large conductance mechanosensitive channel
MAQPKKSLAREFREFIWSANLIYIAVGLILALQITNVISAFMEGIFTPILAAIVGKPNFNSFGFDIGDARISIGLFLTAVFNLVVVGAVLFLIIKLYTAFKTKDEESGPSETQLLMEIRDLLRQRQP